MLNKKQIIIVSTLLIIAAVVLVLTPKRDKVDETKPELAADRAALERVDGFSLGATLVSVDASHIVFTTARLDKTPTGNSFVEKQLKAELPRHLQVLRKTNTGTIPITLEQMIKDVPAGTKLVISGYGDPFDEDGPGVTKIEISQ